MSTQMMQDLYKRVRRQIRNHYMNEDEDNGFVRHTLEEWQDLIEFTKYKNAYEVTETVEHEVYIKSTDSTPQRIWWHQVPHKAASFKEFTALQEKYKDSTIERTYRIN